MVEEGAFGAFERKSPIGFLVQIFRSNMHCVIKVPNLTHLKNDIL